MQLVLSRRRCLKWMIITSSDSTISFSVVVKVPAYHPSDSGSIPARVTFYIFFIWFYGQSRLFHSFWADSIVRWGDEPRKKPPDHPRVERLAQHVARPRRESSADRCLNFLYAFLILCNSCGWQMSCHIGDLHNQCDHKDISSEKTLNSGVKMSKFVWVSQDLCTCQLQLRPLGVRESKDISRFSAY